MAQLSLLKAAPSCVRVNRGAGQAPKETLAPGVTQGRAPALPTFLVVGKLLGENSARCVTVPRELARRGGGRKGFDAGRCHMSRGPGRCLGRDRRGGAGRYGREAVFEECGELFDDGDGGKADGHRMLMPVAGGHAVMAFQLGFDDGEAAFVVLALEVVVESD